jgi:hypothetical protein
MERPKGYWYVSVAYGIARHEDIFPLTAEAKWLYLTCICFCGERLTDGAFTSKQLMSIMRDAGANSEHFNELVEASLILEIEQPSDNNWYIRNYERYQQTKAEITRKREQSAVRQSRRRDGDVTRDTSVIHAPNTIQHNVIEYNNNNNTNTTGSPDVGSGSQYYQTPTERREWIESTLNDADKNPERFHWREWMTTQVATGTIRNKDAWMAKLLTAWIDGEASPPDMNHDQRERSKRAKQPQRGIVIDGVFRPIKTG